MRPTYAILRTNSDQRCRVWASWRGSAYFRTFDLTCVTEFHKGRRPLKGINTINISINTINIFIFKVIEAHDESFLQRLGQI